MAMKLGLISPEMRAQFAQWGEVPDVEPLEVQSHEEVIELVERALQNDDPLEVKVTNLELIQEFCATQRLGKLHLSVNDQDAEFDVVFGISRAGDIILPWRSEDISDALLNPVQSYLEWVVDDVVHSVYFKSVEDSYYGDVKAFIVCAPAVLHKKQVEHGNAS
jgi:hypothetical protein